jgi:glycine cleavage system H protein
VAGKPASTQKEDEMIPDNLKYTRRHEWCRLEADQTVVFGLTDDAVEGLSDVLFVELPDVGDDVLADVPCGELESLKKTLDIYSPLDGEVIQVNTRVLDEARLVLEDPYGEGWLVRMRPTDPTQIQELLTPAQYAGHRSHGR